jgi:hypothetical protein
MGVEADEHNPRAEIFFLSLRAMRGIDVVRRDRSGVGLVECPSTHGRQIVGDGFDTWFPPVLDGPPNL